jgi:hypothetical protein
VRYNKKADSLNDQLNEMLHTNDDNALMSQLAKLYENPENAGATKIKLLYA